MSFYFSIEQNIFITIIPKILYLKYEELEDIFSKICHLPNLRFINLSTRDK